MKRLAVVVLLALAAGCGGSPAANPYPSGTREYERWQRDYDLRQARHSFMFEGHDLPESTIPPGSVPRHERD